MPLWIRFSFLLAQNLAQNLDFWISLIALAAANLFKLSITRPQHEQVLVLNGRGGSGKSANFDWSIKKKIKNLKIIFPFYDDPWKSGFWISIDNQPLADMRCWLGSHSSDSSRQVIHPIHRGKLFIRIYHVTDSSCVVFAKRKEDLYFWGYNLNWLWCSNIAGVFAGLYWRDFHNMYSGVFRNQLWFCCKSLSEWDYEFTYLQLS